MTTRMACIGGMIRAMSELSALANAERRQSTTREDELRAAAAWDVVAQRSAAATSRNRKC
jgi:hypothetical protein